MQILGLSLKIYDGILRVPQYWTNDLKGACKGIEYSNNAEKPLNFEYWICAGYP